MTKAEAAMLCRNLVSRYGLRWGADVPAAAHADLARIKTVLTEAERRAALRNEL